MASRTDIRTVFPMRAHQSAHELGLSPMSRHTPVTDLMSQHRPAYGVFDAETAITSRLSRHMDVHCGRGKVAEFRGPYRGNKLTQPSDCPQWTRALCGCLG